jgi:hypothetical protein
MHWSVDARAGLAAVGLAGSLSIRPPESHAPILLRLRVKQLWLC